MAKSKNNKNLERIIRLKLSQRAIYFNSKIGIASNSPSLMSAMAEVIKPHFEDLSLSFKVLRHYEGSDDELMDESIDQYLINKFNCEFHNEFSLYYNSSCEIVILPNTH